jgi:hypothetical protein
MSDELNPYVPAGFPKLIRAYETQLAKIGAQRLRAEALKHSQADHPELYETAKEAEDLSQRISK